jgi:hypothetical protein
MRRRGTCLLGKDKEIIDMAGAGRFIQQPVADDWDDWRQLADNTV